MISPLSLTPLVPMPGRFIYAGIADRLVHPREQVTRRSTGATQSCGIRRSHWLLVAAGATVCPGCAGAVGPVGRATDTARPFRLTPRRAWAGCAECALVAEAHPGDAALVAFGVSACDEMWQPGSRTYDHGHQPTDWPRRGLMLAHRRLPLPSSDARWLSVVPLPVVPIGADRHRYRSCGLYGAISAGEIN